MLRDRTNKGAELPAFLRERVARFKVPRIVKFVESLPRTPTGKLLVRQLKKTSKYTVTVYFSCDAKDCNKKY